MLKQLTTFVFGAAVLAVTPVQAATVFVVAGGGGGGFITGGGNGQFGTAGSTIYGGNGGTNGSGGDGGGAGGGAGVLSAGGAGQEGAQGGITGPSYAGGSGTSYGGYGGYGGGGGSGNGGGGGGGYSGGGGGNYGNGGGGGGSYVHASLNAIAGLPLLNPGNANYNAEGANGFITITDKSTGLFQTFGYTGAVQAYTFATAGLYDIVAAGAQGGNGNTFFRLGGLGAVIGGEGSFTAGTTLSLIVGGGGSGSAYAGGGGGGSFVFLDYAAPEAAAVPEPATWAMMIVGFGLVGGALRRRPGMVVSCAA